MKAIMYHYVREENPDLPFFRHLHIDDFIRQLDYFGNKYGFVQKQDFIHAIKYGTPTPGVILTFDDGFKDHFRYVLPALAARNLWGIFYIATGPYHNQQLIDVHRVHMLVGKFGGKKIAANLDSIISDHMLSHDHVEEFHTATYTKQNNDDFTNYVKRMLNYFIDYRYRASVIDQLMQIYFPKEQLVVSDFYMSDSELLHLKQSGMIVGSHTVNHPVMSKLTKREQHKEITYSFQYIENTIGTQTLKTFCYPYGGFHSFTVESEDLLNANGVHFSFNVESRDIAQEDLISRKQALPRYDCNEFPFGSYRI